MATAVCSPPVSACKPSCCSQALKQEEHLRVEFLINILLSLLRTSFLALRPDGDRSDSRMIQFSLRLPSPFPRTAMLLAHESVTVKEIRKTVAAFLSIPTTHLVVQTQRAQHGPELSRLTLGMLAQEFEGHLLELSNGFRMLGGKGGFGSMLRAAGGKMSSAKRKNGEENRDACRDLNGRRLSVMKEARKLAAYLEQEPERRRAMDERTKAKYARLEKMLGRTPRGKADLEEAARKMGEDETEMEDADEFDSDDADAAEGAEAEAGPSRLAGPSAPKPAGGKVERAERFEDHEYLEQSREIVSNARSAVAAAMKKKKKAAAAKSKASTEAHL